MSLLIHKQEMLCRHIHHFYLFLDFPLGDMELKQNEVLPAERQIVTAEPELKTVSCADPFLSILPFLKQNLLRIALASDQVKLSEDDEFIVLACDGIWYGFSFCTQCRFGFITQLHCYIHLHSFYLRAPSACDKKILERMPQSILTSSHCIITPEKKDNAIILLP